MGLDTTHDAFHGAYSAFHRLRMSVAEAAGGRVDECDLLTGSYEWHYDPAVVAPEHLSGLAEFMSHSDCDGVIDPYACRRVAAALESLLPRVTERHGGGHLRRRGGVRGSLAAFIAGCRQSASRHEMLEFW